MKRKLSFLGGLLALVLFSCLSSALFVLSAAAEDIQPQPGFTADNGDYYAYTGGEMYFKNNVALSSVTDAMIAKPSLKGGAEISFSGYVSEYSGSDTFMFFGIFDGDSANIKYFADSRNAYATFRIDRAGLAKYSPGTSGTDRNVEGTFTATQSNTTINGTERKVRMAVDADGGLKIYVDDVAYADYPSIYADEMSKDPHFGFAFMIRSNASIRRTVSDLRITGADGKLLLVDDATALAKLDENLYVFSDNWKTSLPTVSECTEGTLERMYNIVAEKPSGVIYCDQEIDLTPTQLLGSDATLTVTANGNPVTKDDATGKYLYTVPKVSGGGEINVTYVLTKDGEEKASQAYSFTAAERTLALQVDSVPDSADAGTSVDLTPTVLGASEGEYTLTAVIKKGEGTIATLTEVPYTYAFAQMGTYTVEYSVQKDEDTVTASKEITVNYVFDKTDIGGKATVNEPITFTPVLTGAPDYTVETVIKKGNDTVATLTQSPYTHTFTEQGIYTVQYVIKNGTETVQIVEGETLRAENEYKQSYLTMIKKHGYSGTIQNHMTYVNVQLNGAVTVEFDVKLGVRTNISFLMGLFSATSYNQITSFTDSDSVAVNAPGLKHLGKKNGVVFDKALAINEAYKDLGNTSDANFMHKTSFRMAVDADGGVKVYAKVIEDEALFIGDNYEVLSSDYVLLYETPDDDKWYASLMQSGNFYFGWGVSAAQSSEDAYYYRIRITDENSNIVFLDNFTDFGTDSYVMGNGITAAYNAGKIAKITGEDITAPQIDASAVPRNVRQGATVDVSARLEGFGDATDYTATVTDPDGETLAPVEGNVYKFEKQGVYTVAYSAELADGAVIKTSVKITARADSTQKTAEENFDGGTFSGDYWDYKRAAVTDGKLLISASAAEDAYFTTAGVSENFMLTLDIAGMVSGTDEFSLAFGITPDSAYMLTFTAGSTEAKLSGKGIETTSVDIGSDLAGLLAAGKTVTLRLEVMSATAKLYVTDSDGAIDRIDIAAATFEKIVNVGKAGVCVSDGNGVYVDNVQFVNMTSLPNDNTTTEVPVAPPEPGGDKEPEGQDPDSGESGCGCSSAISVLSSMWAVLLLGAAATLALRGKKDRNSL